MDKCGKIVGAARKFDKNSYFECQFFRRTEGTRLCLEMNTSRPIFLPWSANVKVYDKKIRIQLKRDIIYASNVTSQ